jgi:hypothetical protein
MNRLIKISVLVTALIVIMASLAITTFAALGVNKNISSSGSITVTANLGVYSDSACQNAITTINWGSITPGQDIARTIYIKNTGLGTSLTLSMETSNWSPANANGPITITWDKQGTVLAPAQSTAAVLTLSVSSSISGVTDFGVQVDIIGTSP